MTARERNPERPLSRVHTRVGLLFTAATALCLAVPVAIWFFSGAATEDEPVYPRQHVLTAPAAEPGREYGDLNVGGPGGLCDHVDRARVGLVLPVTGSRHTFDEGDNATSYECRLSLSNLDAFPHNGAEGEFRVELRTFASAGRAETAHEARVSEFSDSGTARPVHGMELDAAAFRTDWGTWELQTIVVATDGNMDLLVSYSTGTADHEVPDVPADVLVAICVDTANELATLVAVRD